MFEQKKIEIQLFQVCAWLCMQNLQMDYCLRTKKRKYILFKNNHCFSLVYYLTLFVLFKHFQMFVLHRVELFQNVF